jgi:hypothetical protein
MEKYNPIVESVFASKSIGTEMRDPKKAVYALEMLCNGHGYKEVGEMTGLDFQTVIALKARHGQAIEVRRRQLAEDGFELAEGARLLIKEKMRMLAGSPELLQKEKLKDLSVSYAIYQDKAFIAAEGNKTVVEHVKKGVSLEEAQRVIDEARFKKAVVVEVPK